MYKLPKEKEIRKAIYKSLRKYGGFSSLSEFRKEILTELKKLNKEYTISMKRAKLLAVHSGFVKFDVKKKCSNKIVKKCPVCGDKMQEIKNLDLLGNEIIIGYKCKSCKYKGRINEVPARYKFYFI